MAQQQIFAVCSRVSSFLLPDWDTEGDNPWDQESMCRLIPKGSFLVQVSGTGKGTCG